MAAASEFIEQFFGARTTLPICIAALANDRAEADKFPPREIYTRNPKKIDKFVATYDVSGRAIYFCVSTIKTGKRRNKANVDELHCLHADIDFKNVDETPAEIERVVQALPLPPRWVVLSGHGLHLYWLLQQVFKATVEVAQRIERALKRLAWALAGDPAVCEVARLMRVPGSHNTKGGDKLLVQTLVENKVEYELEALETWLADVKQPLLHAKGAEVLLPKSNGPTNPFTAYGEQYARSDPLDIDGMLDDMVYPGNVHDTERNIVASLISRGEPVDNVVAYLTQQLQARISESAGWNWAQEIKELRFLCVTWFEKHPDLLDKQETKPDWLRNHSKIRPLLEGIDNVIELKTVKDEKKKEEQGPPPELETLFAEELERREVKQLEWIVKDFVLAHALNGLFGDGGVGKDLLLMQLAIAMTCEVPWLGKPVLSGKVLYFLVEDDLDEVRRRQDAINSSLGIKASDFPQRLKIVPMMGKDTILAKWDSKAGVVGKTKLFDSIRNMIADFQPALVIVGNRVNIFSVSQNDDAQARQCIGLLNSLCVDFGCGVIMPSHISLGGKASGEGTSGSVQWNNGIRLRMYLRRVVDEEKNEKNTNIRELEVMKSNYSAKGEMETLLWEKSVLHRSTPEGVIEKLKVVEGESEADAKVRHVNQSMLDDEREFMRMFDKYVATGNSIPAGIIGVRENAPKSFSKDPSCKLSGEKGKARLRAAMERLIARGNIQPVEEGPPSKRKMYLKKVGLHVVK